MPSPQHMTAVKEWIHAPTIAERLFNSLPAGWTQQKRENMASRIQQVMLTLARQRGMDKIPPQKISETMLHIGEMGLDPTPVLGQVYALPFGGKDPTLQIIVGYRGYLELGFRSERLLDLHANVVYQGEHFVYRDGKELVLEHEPDLTRDHEGEEPIATYAVAHLRGGGDVAKVLSKFEVLKFKKRSSAVRSGKQTPWDTDPDAMFMKTAVRRLSPWLPQSSEIFEAAWRYDIDQDRNESGFKPPQETFGSSGYVNGAGQPQGGTEPKQGDDAPGGDLLACPECGGVFGTDQELQGHACPAQEGTEATPAAPEGPDTPEDTGEATTGPAAPLTLADFSEGDQQFILDILKQKRGLRKAAVEAWLAKQIVKDAVVADLKALAAEES